MIKSIFRVILDSHVSLDYKHKRDILSKSDLKADLESMAEVAYLYVLGNINGYNANLLRDSFTLKNYESIIKSYSLKGITVITEESENYPEELKNIPFSPICLYAKGNLELLNSDNKFAIVGSRKTLPSVQKLTEDIARKLSSSGVTIVTGIATGGDLSSIKGAIQNKRVISVLAGGFDFSDKEYNRDYINRLSKGEGLVITEHAPSVKIMPYHYPIRNRIIAGLSKGTLIVSGSFKSGARHTANYAVDYGREVFAIPYQPFTASGELCNKLIKEGAYLTEGVEDISQVCGFKLREQESSNLTDEELKVFKAIKDGSATIDEITGATGLKVFEVMPIVTVLEIKGAVVKNGNGEYVATH